MHKEHITEELRSVLHPAQTLVAVIDMQNDFCAPNGALDKACQDKQGEDLGLIAAMVPHLNTFLMVARSNGVKVAYVQMLMNPQGTPNAYMSLSARMKLREHCLPGTWGADFYGPTAPKNTDARFIKYRYSIFTNPDFPAYLRMNRIETLIVTGVGTPVCVESTVRDAFMSDFNVVVPRDCVATYSPELHQYSLRIMERNFAWVVDSAVITQMWEAIINNGGR